MWQASRACSLPLLSRALRSMAEHLVEFLQRGVRWESFQPAGSEAALLLEIARRTRVRAGAGPVSVALEHLGDKAGREYSSRQIERASTRLVELGLIDRQQQAGRSRGGRSLPALTKLHPLIVALAHAWQAQRVALRAAGKRGADTYPARIVLKLPMTFDTSPPHPDLDPDRGSVQRKNVFSRTSAQKSSSASKPSIHAGAQGVTPTFCRGDEEIHPDKMSGTGIHTPPSPAPPTAMQAEESNFSNAEWGSPWGGQPCLSTGLRSGTVGKCLVVHALEGGGEASPPVLAPVFDLGGGRAVEAPGRERRGPAAEGVRPAAALLPESARGEGEPARAGAGRGSLSPRFHAHAQPAARRREVASSATDKFEEITPARGAAQRGPGRAPSGGNTGAAAPAAARGCPGAPPEAGAVPRERENSRKTDSALHPFRLELVREARRLGLWMSQMHALGGCGPGSAGRDRFARVAALRCDLNGDYGGGERSIAIHSMLALKQGERAGLLLIDWNSVFNAIYARSRKIQSNEFLGESLFLGPVEGSRIVLLDDVKSPEPVLKGHVCAVLETSYGNYQQIYVAPRDLKNSERHILQKKCGELIRANGENVDKGATAGHQLHRWPGSINWKPGRNEFITRLVRLDFTGARLDLSHLEFEEGNSICTVVEDSSSRGSGILVSHPSREAKRHRNREPAGGRVSESELDWAAACLAAARPGATVEAIAGAVAARRGEGLKSKGPDYLERTAVRAVWQIDHSTLDQFPIDWRPGVRYR